MTKIKTYKYSLGDILHIINERIEDLEEQSLPMNSVMHGILLGLTEARDLILTEAVNP